MGRAPRITELGVAYHLLNRRVMRLAMFEKDADYQAFERVLGEGLERPDAPRLLAYCLMPNHWHLVVIAGQQTDLSTWMQWVTVTHTHRWHNHYHTVGEGPLYQGRFKSFPVEEDAHFLTVCRYVERNALRAGLARQAEEWLWCSLACREKKLAKAGELLDDWPVDRPRGWPRTVNLPQNEQELERLRGCVRRGRPYGDAAWASRTAARLGLESTLRPQGRP